MIQISKYSQDNERFQEILARSVKVDGKTLAIVSEIIEDVRVNGDRALFSYMSKFDKVDYSQKSPKLTPDEIEAALKSTDFKYLEAVKSACENLRQYHEKQLTQNYSLVMEDGGRLERRYFPIESIGISVPAAVAPLASSLYMNLIPAKVAGVPRIVVISAPRSGKVAKEIVAIAAHFGVKEIYGISGAQGVAALAYGTETIPRVDKIVGPGNIWVSTAKKLLYGTVGIDFLAGPSEVVILADESANPEFIAIDLLAQAEHGTGLEAAIAFVSTEDKAREIQSCLNALVERFELQSSVQKSLEKYGNIFVVDSLVEAVEACEQIAPEHVELACENAEELGSKLRKYGALFIGQYTPEAVGDYYGGTNHVLPTQGTARFSSGLTVGEFMRSAATVSYDKETLNNNADKIAVLAQVENMKAHKLSVLLRK